MLGLFAAVLAAVFFGAAIYINVGEHPARLNLPVEAALAHWAPAYRRGFAIQASLAVASGLFGLAEWWIDGAARPLGRIARLAQHTERACHTRLPGRECH